MSNVTLVGNDLRSQLPKAQNVTDDIVFNAASAGDPLKAVNQPTQFYIEQEKRWKMTRALMGGTEVIREAEYDFLPKEEAETRRSYDARLSRSVLFGAYKKTISTSTGRPFSKPIDFDKFKKRLLDFNEDIDLQGNNIDVFARNWFMTSLAHSHAFCLIDHPKRPDIEGVSDDLPSLETEQELNLRPYWRIVAPYDVIGWRSIIRNGVEIPTQVRIRETATKDVGMFDCIEVKRVRVLTPGFYELYEENPSNGQWSVVDRGVYLDAMGEPLGRIPIVPFFSGPVYGFYQARPIFEDLAYMNILHWQSQSDQENILHVARVPILFGAGFHEGDNLEIGASRWVRGPEGSTLSYVEHSGAAIQAGRDSLEDLENRMRIMGAEVLVRDPNRITATQKILDTEESNSELQTLVLMFQDALEQAYLLTAQWIGDESAVGEVSIFRDFGISAADFQEANVILQMRLSKQISQETFLDEMKRRGILQEDLNVEDEIALLESETPAMPEPVAEEEEEEDDGENADEGGAKNEKKDASEANVEGQG